MRGQRAGRGRAGGPALPPQPGLGLDGGRQSPRVAVPRRLRSVAADGVHAPAGRRPSMPSLLVLPLLVHDRALGTLVLGSARRGAFGDSVRPTLEVLASHVAVSLSNARMLKRLEELATLDGLTGLLNKRALTELSQHKLRSAKRFKKPLSLLGM
ncbi:MAG: GGDEF domain-containing protein [Polyangiaceae bacterium]